MRKGSKHTIDCHKKTDSYGWKHFNRGAIA